MRLQWSIAMRIGLEDYLVDAGMDYDMARSTIIPYLYDGRPWGIYK